MREHALRCLSVGVVLLAFALAPVAAGANGTIAATYYILPEHHPDVGRGIDDVLVLGLVAKRLGPRGFPVATARARKTGGPSSGPIRDVAADGEIMWWSTASAHGVRLDKSGVETLPLDIENMYPSGQHDDTKAFRTAHFRGTFTTSAGFPAGMKLGSDDDAWVFVDGTLVVDNGGVKSLKFTPYGFPPLSPGTHTIDIFYADRHASLAAIQMATAFATSPLKATEPMKPPGPERPSLTVRDMRAQLQRTGKFTLRDIHFAFDKAILTRDSSAVLSEVGQLMQTDKALRLRIEGHTDNAGDAAYNADLSQQRADAVKQYLVMRARVASNRLSARGYGASRPVAGNATAKGRSLNRRVEFVRM